MTQAITLQAGRAYKLRNHSTFKRYARVFCVGMDGDGNQRAFGVHVHIEDGEEVLDDGNWEMDGSFYSATGQSGLDLVEDLGKIEEAK